MHNSWVIDRLKTLTAPRRADAVLCCLLRVYTAQAPDFTYSVMPQCSVLMRAVPLLPTHGSLRSGSVSLPHRDGRGRGRAMLHAMPCHATVWSLSVLACLACHRRETFELQVDF